MTQTIDLSSLAQTMLQWERAKKQLDDIETAIQDAVLQIGKTQTVGNVRASYSKGRKSYDYQAAADGHPMVSSATIELFTTPKVDWRGICKRVGIDDVPFTQSEPNVSVKLLEGSRQ